MREGVIPEGGGWVRGGAMPAGRPLTNRKHAAATASRRRYRHLLLPTFRPLCRDLLFRR